MSAEDQQGPEQQPSFTLQLTAVDPSMPIQLQDIPQPSSSPQLPQAPPPSQIPDDFWASWTSQQAQSNATLTQHTQHLASLPHHLPRISRNSGRLIVQVGRMATSMEQIRAENSQMNANLSRIIDEQQRHQQALVQIIQHNQVRGGLVDFRDIKFEVMKESMQILDLCVQVAPPTFILSIKISQIQFVKKANFLGMKQTQKCMMTTQVDTYTDVSFYIIVLYILGSAMSRYAVTAHIHGSVIQSEWQRET
ncbi:uncharacterized protein LOC134910942 [Pseudophryne corroboree]|uniref:uncharacterized protein LOC134910942 n=1 Tax=Pseudophryne corroboree TaxID=495146 RepID=UPI00308191B7